MKAKLMCIIMVVLNLIACSDEHTENDPPTSNEVTISGTCRYYILKLRIINQSHLKQNI